MDLIEELKNTIRMEIRPNSQGSEYLEAVIFKQDLELLHSLLKKHLGPAAKEPGKEANLSKEIQEVVDALGGLRNGQSFSIGRRARRCATLLFGHGALIPIR
jgi:hypothetical protein